MGCFFIAAIHEKGEISVFPKFKTAERVKTRTFAVQSTDHGGQENGFQPCERPAL